MPVAEGGGGGRQEIVVGSRVVAEEIQLRVSEMLFFSFFSSRRKIPQ